MENKVEKGINKKAGHGQETHTRYFGFQNNITIFLSSQVPVDNLKYV